MPKKLLIFFLLFWSKNSFSQSYIEMYRNGLLGMIYFEHGQFDSSEKYLGKSLAVIPDKTIFSGYFDLIKIADKHKDTKKMAEYLRALSCVYTKDTLYQHLKEWAEIAMDTATFNKLYHQKCTLVRNKDFSAPHPPALDSIIVALNDRDQGIRSKVNKNKGARTEEEIVALQKEMYDIDSTDFLILYDCIKKYGMPRLSNEHHLEGARRVLILHTDNYRNFEKIDSYLLKAIKEGAFDPADYAYAMDRSLTASGLKPKYYWFIPGSSFAKKYIPGQDEIQKINSNRSQIGLPAYPLWTGMGF